MKPLIQYIPDLRVSREDNFKIKKANKNPKLHEIAELIYESYHGDPASISEKIFMGIFFTLFFVVASIFVVFGIGILFWITGLWMIYGTLREHNKIETFYLSKNENLLIKETIAFGKINRNTWNTKNIRKFLIGLDVDISSSNSTTGVGGTSTRSDHYSLTMILNEPEEERQGSFGQFETVDILKTKIEPRLLELGLEVAQRFEDAGFKVERMVRTVRITQDDLLCPSCNSINQPDARYCASCGTYIDEIEVEGE